MNPVPSQVLHGSTTESPTYFPLPLQVGHVSRSRRFPVISTSMCPPRLRRSFLCPCRGRLARSSFLPSTNERRGRGLDWDRACRPRRSTTELRCCHRQESNLGHEVGNNPISSARADLTCSVRARVVRALTRTRNPENASKRKGTGVVASAPQTRSTKRSGHGVGSERCGLHRKGGSRIRVTGITDSRRPAGRRRRAAASTRACVERQSGKHFDG